METPKFLLFGSTPQQIKRVTRNGSSSIVVEAVAPHGLETSSPWLVRIDGVSGFPDAKGDWIGVPYTDPGASGPSLTKFELLDRFTSQPGDGTTAMAAGTGGTYTRWWDTHDNGQGDLHSGTAVDPNSSLVYLGGSGHVARGDTSVPATNELPSKQWVPISGPGFTPNGTGPHADVRQLLLSSSGALIAMTDGGPYLQAHPSAPTSDWQSLAGDMVTTEMHHIAVDTLLHAYIGGTQDNGSPTQLQPSVGMPIPWTQIDFDDGNTVAVDSLAQRNGNAISYRYTATQDPRNLKRHPFDATGHLPGERLALYDPVNKVDLRDEEVLIGGVFHDLAFMVFSTNPYAGNRLVIGAQKFGVWESADAGDTVTLVPSSPTGATHIAYGAPSNPDLLWISALDGVYKRVSAGGAATKTKYDVSANGVPISIAVLPSNPEVAYVTTDSNVLTTTDGGNNWSVVTGDLTPGAHIGVLRSIVVVPSTGSGDRVFVGAAEDGTPGVFSMATANPKVWTRVGADLPNAQVWDLAYDPGLDTLVAATLGRGAWSIAGASRLDRAPNALCRDVVVVAGSTCQADVSPSAFDNGSRDPDGGALSFSAEPSGPYGVGAYTVTLRVTDPEGVSAACSANLTVKDPTPPQISVPANVTVSSCGSTLAVNVGQASATDDCAGSLLTSGQVISKNGSPLSPPVPVLAGQVNLSPGTYVIQWSASDGFNTVSANQTVTVTAAIQAADTFTLADRAEVRNAAGGYGAIYNSGTGATTIGQHSHTASVLSRATVRVLHYAVVDGDVTSANRVLPDADATINGIRTEFANVQLPALPTLPAFPPATLPGFTVDANSRPKTAQPGSYGSVTAANGGVLTFTAGDFYFQSLYINAGATVRVDPKTRIFVRDQLTYNAPLLALSGTRVQPIYLGYAGTSLLGLYAAFNGTLLAPNAKVTFGTGAGLVYTGSFWARSLEVTPGSALVCSAPQ